MSDGVVYGFGHGARHLIDALRPVHVGEVASEKCIECVIARQNITLPTVSPAHVDILSA